MTNKLLIRIYLPTLTHTIPKELLLGVGDTAVDSLSSVELSYDDNQYNSILIRIRVCSPL